MFGFEQINELGLEKCYSILLNRGEFSYYEEIKGRYEELVTNLSLKESWDFLRSHEDDLENPYYQMVQDRFEKLVEELRKQEERDFVLCGTIADCHNFIRVYESLTPVYKAIHLGDMRKRIVEFEDEKAYLACHSIGGYKEYIAKYSAMAPGYKARHIDDAKRAIQRKKRNRYIVLGGVVLTALVVFLLGYKPVKILEVEDVTFGKEGGEKIIRIETNIGSNAIDLTEPGTDWIHVTKEGKKLIVSAIENPDAERTCTLLLKAYTTFFGERIGNPIKQEVVIRQNSGYATNLNVSTHGFSISKYGGSEQVNIKTDGVALELVSNKSWIHINERSQNHDGQFYHNDDYEIIIEKNPTGQRDGKVVVTAEGQPQQEILISQASGLATGISVSPRKIHCDDADGLSNGFCYKVDFSTDGTEWTISKPDWVNLNQVIDNNGKGHLEVIPVYNPGTFRDGKIIARSNNGHSQEIIISQDGGPSNLSAVSSDWCPGVYSDSKTFSINNNSHYPLKASSDVEWLTASVSGNYVTLKCTSTSSGYKEPRKGTVTVTCRNAKCLISVRQAGYKECDKCKGDGKCRGGNALGQHSWQIYGAIGRHWEPYYYGISGGYWVTDYGYTWQYCSACGGNGKCSKCDGKGKIVCSY